MSWADESMYDPTDLEDVQLEPDEVICHYCGKPAKFTTGEEVYPHRKDLYKKKFFVCTPCDARVGCHTMTGKPFGRLANAELRKMRMKTHKVFDSLWQQKHMSRGEAYSFLRKAMGLGKDDCHIGNFDEDQCTKASAIAWNKLVELREARKSEAATG